MNSEKYFDKFNIMIIGDEKVGKSTILERYIVYSLNIKLDTSIKTIPMTENRLWV